jgi:hypothetical protein
MWPQTTSAGSQVALEDYMWSQRAAGSLGGSGVALGITDGLAGSQVALGAADGLLRSWMAIGGRVWPLGVAADLRRSTGWPLGVPVDIGRHGRYYLHVKFSQMPQTLGSNF